MPHSALSVLPKIGAIRVCRPEQGRPDVTLDSSAMLVMTDLKRVQAAVVSPQETMDEAHAFMMQRGVRMLLRGTPHAGLLGWTAGFAVVYLASILVADRAGAGQARVASKRSFSLSAGMRVG